MTLGQMLPHRLTGDGAQAPWLLEYRSSKTFILITVSTAVFTVSCITSSPWLVEANDNQDIFLYAVIVPVIPFTLHGRAGVAEDEGNDALTPQEES